MYRIFKRILDVLIACVTLVLLSPVFLFVVILLRLTGDGEVLYTQTRIGFMKKRFGALKFATMVKDSLNIGTGSITVRNDPRVTPVGKYLRKSKLNELPQIINVLKGDMSIVGPRPLVESTFSAYSQEVQDVIYSVPPGITGMGSLVFRDEEKYISESGQDPKEYYNLVVAPFKGKLELWYLKNRSIFTDLKIIFATAWLVLFPNSSIVSKFFPTTPKHPIFNK